MPLNKGQSTLIQRVQNRDLCTFCGACASLCPYFRSWEGRLVKLDTCDLETGRCFLNCPRTGLDLDALYGAVFGGKHVPVEMGPCLEVVMARGTDPRFKGQVQTGGAVTALLSSALEGGAIQAAVLTARGEDLLPQGRIARSAGEVLDCAGSSYVAGPALEAFNAANGSGETLGVVGLPCQIQALAKMRLNREFDPDKKIDRLGLTVGLFCTWALDYQSFSGFVRSRFSDRKILGLDISPPPQRLLSVTTPQSREEIPLDEIREFIRPGCKVCLDMTSELADISVGTVEGRPGWNTLAVRTERGRAGLEMAQSRGALETRPLPPESLAHLKEASLLKKSRGLAALRERAETKDCYLDLDSKMGRAIIKAVEGVEA